MSAPIRWNWRWVMDRWINQLIRWTGEQPGSCLPRERKTNTSAGRSNSPQFIGSAVYQKLFCQNRIYNLHIFQRDHTKQFTHSGCTEIFNSQKLNTVIEIHSNVKHKWVMQIIKASKDIAVINVCASVCVCQQKQTKHFNDFWLGGLFRKVFPAPPSVWAIIQLSLLKKLRNSLSLHSCQANSAAVY